LVVAAAPEIQDVICRETLASVGYRTLAARDISRAAQLAEKHVPDCIIAELQMAGGLSARDLMVMLQARNLDIPVIVVAPKGSEADIIQAFRLGAEDYLLWPTREPEILAVVERVLKRIHSHRQRERMEQQIQQANAELQERVRELTTIYAIGKAVTSVTDLGILCEKVLSGALQVTDAHIGWLQLRDEASKVFFLVAHRGLPAEYAASLHKPWDDGVSNLVARTGKMLFLHNDDLARFKVASLGRSLLIVPIKAQNRVIGVLAVMHAEPNAFGSSAIHLLEAVADFASISLVNARLFLAVEERLRSAQRTGDVSGRAKITLEMVQNFNKEQGAIIESMIDTLEGLTKAPASRWNSKQRRALHHLRDQVEGLIHLAEATADLPDA
jgi:two-component system NtrC family sensor kinase